MFKASQPPLHNYDNVALQPSQSAYLQSVNADTPRDVWTHLTAVGGRSPALGISGVSAKITYLVVFYVYASVFMYESPSVYMRPSFKFISMMVTLIIIGLAYP